MYATAVVEDFDVIEQFVFRFLSGREPFVLNHFTLQVAEETFRHRILPTVTCAAHALPATSGGKPLAQCRARILAAAITLEQWPDDATSASGLPWPKRLLDKFDGEALRHLALSPQLPLALRRTVHAAALDRHPLDPLHQARVLCGALRWLATLPARGARRTDLLRAAPRRDAKLRELVSDEGGLYRMSLAKYATALCRSARYASSGLTLWRSSSNCGCSAVR